MAGNPYLSTLCDQMNARATLGFGSEPYPREYLQRARDEHEALADAILSRNAGLAYQAAHDHFSLTLTIMENSLEEHVKLSHESGEK